MTAPAPSSPHPGLGFRAFVGLVASMMALNALAIDAMLPALPDIGRSLGGIGDGALQWVVTAYMLGFGGAQLVHGTLSDRYGRRPLLLIGLGGYVVASLAAALSGSFAMLIAARVVQGACSAASRVAAISLVRDCYAGRQMARVMSLAFIVFLVVPVVAPSVGTLVLLAGPWRWIFVLLGVAAAVVLAISALRLPETLAPERRRAISTDAILSAWGQVLRDRMSVGYTLALTLMSGALFGFINSVQPITANTFGRPGALPLTFACIGGAMAAASLLNARIVERVGTRRVSHRALIGFVACAATHLALAAAGWETLASFVALQAATMFCFALCGANFGAMAMERLGHVAGAAASVQGFVSTVGGALVGYAIGQQFDGSTVPMAAGFTLFGLLSLATVLWTEGGRLFRAQHAPA